MKAMRVEKSLTGNHIPLAMAVDVEEEREAGQKKSNGIDSKTWGQVQFRDYQFSWRMLPDFA